MKGTKEEIKKGKSGRKDKREKKGETRKEVENKAINI
jgi:hypothetical protein